MRVFVRFGDARKGIEVETNPEACPQEILNELEVTCGIPAGAADGLCLNQGRTVLVKDLALAAQGVQEGANLDLGARLRGGMQIWIKTLTGRKTPFNFEADVKVIDVKHALQEKEGIQVDQIRLIFSGKQLADDKQLDDYNVSAGAVIHMVLQLRGGASC